MADRNEICFEKKIKPVVSKFAKIRLALDSVHEKVRI